ncbi:Fumarate reductase iron-sulfur subunit [Novipirellula aureliae]|uniref:succinate dehydrogenase n=1 Tax=Novipirellula aureliae TaxID=2527966 RepID=A0A5C6EF41_9BACT|nr:succinate dehydrogenase iron-sulfur subunit [Novipirellula aureliae]TWU45839.1 Fumarate reductase iron-sulfur subunit [Novipirellula aureliae]
MKRSRSSNASRPLEFEVCILRQDHPDRPSYWQTFRLAYEPGLNITAVLQRIATNPTTATGERTTPVAYDANCLEEVCGSCTMLINGRVRQACSALVDSLLDERRDVIELCPMSKFPVVRDLFVDRHRVFRALQKLECWIPVDTYGDRGRGPLQSPKEQQKAYPLSQCMSCGCCLEACPQYTKASVERRDQETDEEYQTRRDNVLDQSFIGAAAMSQVVLMNSHPTGKMTDEDRIEKLIAPGGIQNCGKAGNCQAVCPKGIPLMSSWARAGRAATIQMIKKFFEGAS